MRESPDPDLAWLEGRLCAFDDVIKTLDELCSKSETNEEFRALKHAFDVMCGRRTEVHRELCSRKR